ncbi:MAG: beta-Ala-His dipeptidase [Candidatus Hodarchaeales archaeon]|jgi:dipeptidase D
MTKVLVGLKPNLVWEIFEQITQVPRPSKKEEKIRAWVKQYALDNKLNFKEDQIGNILINRPASSGKEHLPSVCLQAHLDMVCEADLDFDINFETDPIQLMIQDNNVTAKKTSLGADNGIGMAFALAIATDPNPALGPIECLFTIDEETGMTGAFGIEAEFFKSDLLLNLDGETWGNIIIGAAGGGDTIIEFPFNQIDTSEQQWKLIVTGLQGGHSGVDIHLPKHNAIKTISRALEKLGDVQIGSVMAGSKSNAIPRFAECNLVLPDKNSEKAKNTIKELVNILKNEVPAEKEISMSLEKISEKLPVLSTEETKKFVTLLKILPHGVYRPHPSIEELTETSNNLAIITTESSYFKVILSTRSSIKSQLLYLRSLIGTMGELMDCKVINEQIYPSWKPDLDAPFLHYVSKIFNDITGKDPEHKAVHGGLETAILGQNNPKIQMVSFGPTILDAHSPSERVDIESVEKTYDLIVKVLENLPSDLVH